MLPATVAGSPRSPAKNNQNARPPTLTKLAWLGVLSPGVAYALGLLGFMSITASLSVLLWATEPVLIMLLAVCDGAASAARSGTAAGTAA